MIVFVLGYFVLGIIFLIVRLCYHIFSGKNPIPAISNDFENLFSYARQIILSNPVKFKIIGVIIAIFIIAIMLPIQAERMYTLDVFLSAIIFSVMVIIFLPKEDSQQKKFPVEIFGFIYSVMLMYCSAGELVLEIFSTNNFFDEDMWIYGYSVVIISYLICIATLSRFMERDLSKVEVIFVGMITMTVLEFMTYYGIGFCCGLKWYDPKIFDESILGGIATIVNQGIYIASQSQILERSTREILGYIILNGTDALTVTAVLGYILQKFMETK